MEYATLVLDGLHDRLRNGAANDVADAMHDLFEGLQAMRAEFGAARWREFLQQVAWRHPITSVIHEDPMCRRSFEKPRGYAGDAPLLDYIYKLESLVDASRLGRMVNEYAVERPAAAAVRERREIIARSIDDLASSRDEPIRVLAIAAGHLREASLSVALAGGMVEELVALDADEASLKVIERDYSALPIRTVALSVGRLMTGRRADELGQFDYVYSAGLYDYLNAKTAASLTRSMFDLLKPGGKLLVSNFDPTVADAGYMESYMGWELIYRDAESVREVGGTLPARERQNARVWHGAENAIVYYEAARAESAKRPVEIETRQMNRSL